MAARYEKGSIQENNLRIMRLIAKQLDAEIVGIVQGEHAEEIINRILERNNQ